MKITMKKGFTLIELLVVIAIIGILASMIIVSLSGAREAAQDTQRKNNARNIDTALAQYYVDNSTYPAHTAAGGTDIAATTVPAGLTAYLSGTSAYESTLTHKYISAADAAGVANGKYTQAWKLAKKTETAVTTGNGIYDASSGTVTANGLALTGYTAVANQKAFVTYGPQ